MENMLIFHLLNYRNNFSLERYVLHNVYYGELKQSCFFVIAIFTELLNIFYKCI